ncbi:hypothetical protein [Microbacterium sp. A93]|uniref:hypothetical protein n=1 Tax=Microbacterium sp. A93 TaxID=3450716 RepID=UPI003F41C263
MKEVGEVSAVFDETDPDGGHPIQFKVTNIKPAVCTSDYAGIPDNGNHLVQIDLEVETKKEMRDLFTDWGVSHQSDV